MRFVIYILFIGKCIELYHHNILNRFGTIILKTKFDQYNPVSVSNEEIRWKKRNSNDSTVDLFHWCFFLLSIYQETHEFLQFSSIFPVSISLCISSSCCVFDRQHWAGCVIISLRSSKSIAIIASITQNCEYLQGYWINKSSLIFHCECNSYPHRFPVFF